MWEAFSNSPIAFVVMVTIVIMGLCSMTTYFFKYMQAREMLKRGITSLDQSTGQANKQE